jgi:hypothetical protein
MCCCAGVLSWFETHTAKPDHTALLIAVAECCLATRWCQQVCLPGGPGGPGGPANAAADTLSVSTHRRVSQALPQQHAWHASTSGHSCDIKSPSARAHRWVLVEYTRQHFLIGNIHERRLWSPVQISSGILCRDAACTQTHSALQGVEKLYPHCC